MLLHHCSGTTDLGLHLESLSKISRQPPFIYSVKYAVTFAYLLSIVCSCAYYFLYKGVKIK